MSKKRGRRAQTAAPRWVIVVHSEGALTFGSIADSDHRIAKTRSVRVNHARHIGYYECAPGGVTSLAASGPRPQTMVGEAAPSLLCLNVATVMDCSEEAIKAFSQLESHK